MALNFPANPVDGQAFGNYTYNSSKGVWSASATPPRYTVSANVPATAANGDVWFNSETARSYIYYEDSDSSQWVEIGGSEGATGVVASLGSIPGVDLTGLEDGKTLVYDAANSEWIPGEAGGKFTVSDTAPVSAENGDTWFKSDDGKTYIYYVDTDGGQWVEIASNTTGYLDIGQLNDVTIVSPTTGQALTYDGSGWVNATPASTLDSLTDVDTTGVADGQALVYDSATSEWMPGDVAVDIYDTTNSSTGYLSIPKGTDAQRPQNPINGDMRFNTESEEPEWYSETAGQWIKFRLSPAQDFEYLVIAGGGGAGGYYSGGGGGAGGYRSSVAGQLSGGLQPEESTLSFAAGDVFTVTVGAGGSGGASATSNDGLKGSDSVLASIVSFGGGAGPGGGRTLTSSAKDGGSGGGASGNVANNLGGLGTTGQGFSGGNASTNGANYGAAGGGGAGEAGQDGTLNSNGNGGAGIFSNITGTSIQRGGGGGAGSHTPLFGADGGAGGGGDGGKTANAVGSPGAINTGGGGGGGQYSNPGANGGSGGSGIVIIRYPATFNLTIGGGLAYVTTVVGDKKVTQFTAGTDAVTVG